MSAELLAVIRAHYSSLTSAQRDIADFVLSNSHEVVYMPITELAYCCSVSQTSVERFCHKLGQPGYRRFRLALSAAAEAQRQLTPFAPPEGDPLSQLLDRLHGKYLTALGGTRHLLSTGRLEQAAARLLDARQIYLFAAGRALPAAMAAYQAFTHMLWTCAFTPDPHTQRKQAEAITCDDVALFFSCGGKEETLMDMATECKKATAFTLLCTCGGGSALSQRCDSTLCCCINQNPAEAAPTDEITAQASFAYMTEALCAACRGPFSFSTRSSAFSIFS